MDTKFPMSLIAISEALQDRRLYKVAEETGLSYPTIKSLADAKMDNYTLNTLIKVSEYIRNTPAEANEKE